MTSTFSKAIALVVFLVSSLQFLVSSTLAQCGGTWTQRTPADAPSARYAHAMAYDSARGVTVLFGGYATNYSAETWEWSGANWTLRSPADAPLGRERHAIVYDSARGVTVLFGGFFGGGKSDETWEWDGTNWSQSLPADAPTARDSHAMAFDSIRGVTVLFGGNADPRDAETWEYDGTNWSQKSPADAPSARNSHAMAFDSARGVTELFGGDTAGGESADTWEWDGANWSQRTPAPAPSARLDHAMDYDPARGVIVLFGGYDGAFDGETWEWNGATWVQRSPATAPSARLTHAMAYDSARGVTVLFGGSANPNNNETWEWTGPTPAISEQPAALTVAPGQPAAFSITAGGLGPLTYRWRKDGALLADGGAIAGATTAGLTINPTVAADSGSYTCLVSNPCGATLSRAAALVVDVCLAVDATGDCDGNGVLDSCDIAAVPSLDANANGTLDSCESSGCGMCGGGLPAMMPLALLGLAAIRRRRTSRSGRKSEKESQ